MMMPPVAAAAVPAGPPIVTPANSREEPGGDWLAQLEAGVALSEADWAQLAQDRGTIPWLDAGHADSPTDAARPGLLVRARGMVQDMLETEYFATARARRDEDGDGVLGGRGSPLPGAPALAERTPLLVAPIPFTTPWFRDVLRDGREPHRPKRHRLSFGGEEAEAEADLDADPPPGGEEPLPADPEEGVEEAATDDDYWPSRRMQSDPQSVPFLAKLYYDQYCRGTGRGRPVPKLLLNQIVELVGVVEPVSPEDDDEDVDGADPAGFGDARYDDWGNLRLPSKQSLPRLHVLWYQAVDMDALVATEQIPPTPFHSSSALLAGALGVPDTVGAALWMSLLSLAERQPLHEVDTHWATVQTPQDAALGCAALNVVLPSPAACARWAPRLYRVLAQVLPQVQCRDVTAAALGADLAPPRKRQGRLAPTALQLPQGATLVLNVGAAPEAELAGLSPAQAERLRVLQQLVAGHRLPYTFDGGVQIPFEADVRIIVLSTRATRHLLPCALQVACPMEAGGDAGSEAPAESMETSEGNSEPEPNLGDLNAVRNALAASRGGPLSSGPARAPHKNISLPHNVLEQAQADFVQRREAARRNAPASALPDDKDFHRWLTLTRLQARSRRAAVADLTDWRRALELDDAMRATLRPS